ncbi:energy transducer TonB family protein [Phenylobacterium koreense]
MITLSPGIAPGTRMIAREAPHARDEERSAPRDVRTTAAPASLAMEVQRSAVATPAAFSSSPASEAGAPPSRSPERATDPPAAPEADRAAYGGRLWAWIAARRPAGIHFEGEALVRFSVDRDGRLRKLSLDRSSGAGQLDRLALRTVRLAAPFPRPPESLAADESEFTLAFHFN